MKRPMWSAVLGEGRQRTVIIAVAIALLGAVALVLVGLLVAYIYSWFGKTGVPEPQLEPQPQPTRHVSLAYLHSDDEWIGGKTYVQGVCRRVSVGYTLTFQNLMNDTEQQPQPPDVALIVLVLPTVEKDVLRSQKYDDVKEKITAMKSKYGEGIPIGLLIIILTPGPVQQALTLTPEIIQGHNDAMGGDDRVYIIATTGVNFRKERGQQDTFVPSGDSERNMRRLLTGQL